MSETTEQMTGCVHDFSYLTKKYEDGGFTARVMEIPAVIVSSNDESKLESEIKEVTKGYLKTFIEEHKKAKEGLLKPILISPQRGVVVGVKRFKVKC